MKILNKTKNCFKIVLKCNLCNSYITETPKFTRLELLDTSKHPFNILYRWDNCLITLIQEPLRCWNCRKKTQIKKNCKMLLVDNDNKEITFEEFLKL